jgi:scyllo-inositol 2-dehydrogenase (NADP+)
LSLPRPGFGLYDLGSRVVDQSLVLFGAAVRVYAETGVRMTGAAADDDTFIALTPRQRAQPNLYMSAATAQLGP